MSEQTKDDAAVLAKQWTEELRAKMRATSEQELRNGLATYPRVRIVDVEFTGVVTPGARANYNVTVLNQESAPVGLILTVFLGVPNIGDPIAAFGARDPKWPYQSQLFNAPAGKEVTTGVDYIVPADAAAGIYNGSALVTTFAANQVGAYCARGGYFHFVIR